MKTALCISSLLLFSSATALGASLTLQCANSQLAVNIELEQGETCSGTQTLVLNGSTEETAIANDSIPIAPLNLQPDDRVMSTVSLTCELNGGTASISDMVSSEVGCSGAGNGNSGNSDDNSDDRDDDVQPRTVRVVVTNLTRGNYFTPLALAAHTQDTYFFRVGEPASEGLQAMAEGGDITLLMDSLPDEGVIQTDMPLSGGLLSPGSSTNGEAVFRFTTDGTYYISVAGMILPSNDGFVGIDSLRVPSNPGTYTVLLNAYDAGSEGNDEQNTGEGAGAPSNAGFPVPPPLAESVGQNGSGFDLEPEGFVHVHRGVIGDTDPSGGVSDIDASVHRWLNPVARLIITVE